MEGRELGLLEKLFGVEAVGEVGFVEVEAGDPLLGLAFWGFAVAEVFHEVGGGVFEPDWDGVIRGFVGERFCALPGVVGAAVFR